MKFTAGYFQYKPIFGEVSENVRRVCEVLSTAEADLIVLPELAFTGYHFLDRAEVNSLAEDVNDSTSLETITALCKERDFYIVTGFAERHVDKLYNSAVLIGPHGVIHSYRKIHLFNREKEYFDPGNTPLSIQTIRGVNLGLMVCFDWAFPEVTRTLALKGADVICHPSNLVLGYCQQAMLTRCLENRVFAITTNRYGADKRPHGELCFTGRSQIVAPGGQLVHAAQSQEDELFITEFDIMSARDKSITPLNDLLSDRRVEYYKI